jgi:hypothetical protein
MGLYDNNNVTFTHAESGQQITIGGSATSSGNNPYDKPEREMLFARSQAPSRAEVRAASGRASRKAYGWKRALKDPMKQRGRTPGSTSKHAPLDMS